EFKAATEAGLDPLGVLLGTHADDGGLPGSKLTGYEFGGRQGGVPGPGPGGGPGQGGVWGPGRGGGAGGAPPGGPGRGAAGGGRRGGGGGGAVAGAGGGGGGGGRRGPGLPVVVGDVPQEPAGFQPRADLLAELDAPGPRGRVRVVHAVTGMRGVGKTQL